MNILITGATGFIGTHLIKALNEAGHNTSILTRSREHGQLQELKQTLNVRKVFVWDQITKPSKLEGLENTDAIIHLAGEPVIGLWTAGKRTAISESRILGTKNLIKTLLISAAHPKIFISASAVGFYGDRGDMTLTEGSGRGSGYLAEVCESWEFSAREAETIGARVTSLRLGLVFGSTGGSLPSLIKATSLGLGGPLGSGRQWWPWIHITDVIGCIMHLLNEPFDGPLNLVSREPLQQRELITRLGKILHRPTIIPIPRIALRLILGEMATEFLNSRRVISARMEEANYEMQFPSFNEAIANILEKNPSHESEVA